MASSFSRLGRADIRKLAPGGSITEHGITAQKLANGDVRYTVNVMVDGARIHRVVGLESDGVTRSQAEQFIEAARTKAREGRFNLPKGRKLAPLFSEAAAQYENAPQKNLKVKKRQLRMYLKPFFGASRLDAIPEDNVAEYKVARAASGASIATVNRELATLKHLLGWSLKRKIVPRVEYKPELEREDGGRIIALTDRQCEALMKAAVAHQNSYLWLFVAFGLNTAMRHSEILAARFDVLDIEGCRLFVPEAKAGQREQPITRELAAILTRELAMRERCGNAASVECGAKNPACCLTHGGWVFPSPHKDSKTGHIARMDGPFDEAAAAAGLDAELVTPHVMRHTAITALVKGGADLATIQKISGHKTLSALMRYVHVHSPHIDAAISKIGRGIGGPAPDDKAPARAQLRVVK
jgi:integrase